MGNALYLQSPQITHNSGYGRKNPRVGKCKRGSMAHTYIYTAIPYPMIWDEGQFLVRVGGKLFNVGFKRVYRQPGDQPPAPSVAQAQGVEIKYDRQARAAHTQIEIAFPDIVNDLEERESWIQFVINRLIEVYRYTTGEFFLELIPKHEMWPFDSGTVNEHGVVEAEMESSIPFRGGVTIARTSPIPDSARRLLFDGTELPISRILYLNS